MPRIICGIPQHRVVLINGRRLAELMLAHGVGVRTRATYLVRTVDRDFFDEAEI